MTLVFSSKLGIAKISSPDRPQLLQVENLCALLALRGNKTGRLQEGINSAPTL